MNFTSISSTKRGMTFTCLLFSLFLLLGIKQAQAQINVPTDDYYKSHLKLSQKELETQYSVWLLPNEIRIKSLLPMLQNAQIRILDVVGNPVFEAEWKAENPIFESAWQSVPNHVYFLCIKNGKEEQTLKFSIAK
jgi:hypothetical protein